MAQAPVLYRARMTRTDPMGSAYTWYEGPYPADHAAQGRISFWEKKYATDPERVGWKVQGEVESAEMRWKRR